MKALRLLTAFAAFAMMSLSMQAQPNIGLRPDRTVFFYANDAP